MPGLDIHVVCLQDSYPHTAHSRQDRHLPLTLPSCKSTIITIRYQTSLPSLETGNSSLVNLRGLGTTWEPERIYTTAGSMGTRFLSGHNNKHGDLALLHA
jgi:hypothetical protein